MNLLRCLIALACVATADSAMAKKPKIVGVGDASCVQSSITGLEAGLPLTLLDESGKTRGFAILGDPIKSCLGDRNGGSGYLLRNATPMEDMTLAIAGDVPESWHVRSCTSLEGAHFLVYNGKNRSPIADEYYYAGYDTEPSCSEEDGKAIRGLKQPMTDSLRVD